MSKLVFTESDFDAVWDFEDDATRWVDDHPDLTYADEMESAVLGYRAGAAASEARIKALEAALQDVVADYDWVCDDPVHPAWNVLDNTIIRARALLKESDQ